MARILFVYATRHGHTRAIADRVACRLRNQGHVTDLVDSSNPPEPLAMLLYDAFFIASSVNGGKHLPSIVSFVRRHRFELSSAPTAFLSVSSAAMSQDLEHKAQAQMYIDDFIDETGFSPTFSLAVAGALEYTKHPWIARVMLRMIVKHTGGEHGGDIDTTKDYEYTDWKTLDQFADEFVSVATVPAAALI